MLLHHLRIGRSIFTVWLLEELGLEYELKFYDRNEMGRAPPELKEAHPLGKSPVLEVDGFTLAESGAITSYLIKYHDPDGTLAPPADTDRAAYGEWVQWLHYSEASAFAPLLLKLLLMREDPKPPVISAFATGEIPLQLGYIENFLGDKPFLLGDKLQAADFGTTYIVSMADRLGELSEFPKLKAYLERNMARAAFQSAVGKVGS